MDIFDSLVKEIETLYGDLSDGEKKAVEAIHILGQFDAKGAMEAIQQKQLTGILGGVDEVLSIAGLFFPPAATAAQWVKLLEKAAPAIQLLAALYKAGLIRGVDYKDPNYNAPAGPEGTGGIMA